MKYLVKFKDGRKTTVFYEGSLIICALMIWAI